MLYFYLYNDEETEQKQTKPKRRKKVYGFVDDVEGREILFNSSDQYKDQKITITPKITEKYKINTKSYNNESTATKNYNLNYHTKKREIKKMTRSDETTMDERT